MESNRLIYHIDVNSAFLSWESVYRMDVDDTCVDLRTIASAVGGDPASRRGVILAKSELAKAKGVKTGEPIAKSLNKCPELVIVPSRFDFYIKQSKKLIELLETYTPDIEKFSIDEAFLDMTTTIHLFGDPLIVADQIRNQIEQELSFTVNIGISTNKLLAKMASDFQKPNLTHTLFPYEVKEKLWPLPINELFFVGNSAHKKLTGIGLYTIGDVACCDLRILKSHLGDKYASLIHRYANGIDDEPVAKRSPINKGYGNSITLSQDISDFESASHVLLSLSETVGARLRSDGVNSNCITVEIKDWNFQSTSHQMKLPTSTDSTSTIYQTAYKLLKEFWDLTPLRLLGVRAGNISDDAYEQISIFDNEQNKKMKTMEKTIDSIRKKFGTDIVKRASFLKTDTLVDHTVAKKKHFEE